MTAEIVSIFDHPKFHKPKPQRSTDDLYMRWSIISMIGTREESYKAATEYYTALLGTWPQADKPCDTE